MADNTQLSLAVGVGDVVRDLADAGGVKWPVGVVCYATTVSAGANVLDVVQLTSGLPVQPQTGSTWAVTQSGTWTVQQGSAPWSVSQSGNWTILGITNTVTVSGTVTANAGTSLNTSALALESGGNLATIAHAVNTSTNTMQGNLVQVGGSSFALGQQLAVSSLPVVLTASQLSTLTPLATVTADQGGAPWSVSQSGNWTITSITNTVSVSGTVTANAGTNLNTSALALESGGNLAKIVQAINTTSNTVQDNLAQVGGTNFALGQQLAATSLPVVLTAAQVTTLTPLATITANAGTNLNTSVLALDTSVNGVLQAQNAATSGAKGPMVQGLALSSAPTYVNNTLNPLSLDTGGNTRVLASQGGTWNVNSITSTVNVSVVGGSTSNPAAGPTNTTVPADASYSGVNVAGKLQGQTGVSPATNTYAASCDLTSVGGTSYALGQQLAASSMPVVLTAAQITTLTPLAAVQANAGTNLNTSALALDTSVNGILVAQNSATSGQKGPLIQGAVTTAAPAYTNTNTAPLSLDTSGNLRALASQSGTWNIGTLTSITNQVNVSAAQQGNWTVQSITNTVNVSITGTNTVNALQSGTWTVQQGTPPWTANPKDPAATTGSITAADATTSTATNSLGQSVTTGAPTANSSVSCTVTGEGTISLELTNSATHTVVFAIERSVDGGTTYVPMSMEVVGVGTVLSTVTTTDTNANVLRCNVSGMTTVRVRCTTYVAGSTITVNWQPSYEPSMIPVGQLGAPWTVNANATQQGTWNVGVTNTLGTLNVAQAGTWNTNILTGITNTVNVSIAGLNSVGQGPAGAVTAPWPVQLIPGASGGLSMSKYISGTNTNNTSVKNTAGQLYEIVVSSICTSVAYLKLYNSSTAPVAGNANYTPTWTLAVPASANGAGIAKTIPGGLNFNTGIAFALTLGIADSDNTCTVANTLVVNLGYK